MDETAYIFVTAAAPLQSLVSDTASSGHWCWRGHTIPTRYTTFAHDYYTDATIKKETRYPPHAANANQKGIHTAGAPTQRHKQAQHERRTRP